MARRRALKKLRAAWAAWMSLPEVVRIAAILFFLVAIGFMFNL